MTSNAALMARDLNVLWHPCTQMKDHHTGVPLIPIKKAAGLVLEDFDGNHYLDAVSSWWVNIFGHCNPSINQAIKTQLDQLEHVILAGFSHEPAIALAEQLINLTAPSLTRCFYADNGSAAVESALKMSFHYWQNIGRPEKTQFVHLSNSYHGETIGAMSVSDVPLYKTTYHEMMHPYLTVQAPDCFHREPEQSWEDYSRQAFTQMEATLQQHADTIAAVIVEPLVQCAGGMRMYHPIYLQLLREACDKYQIHLIADEIAVGFGRTGTLFACEQADIAPDFMCLSKGITGGYLPLSTVLTTETVYQAFYHDYNEMKAFLHSHSYTGNALACTAALATLALFEKNNTLTQNAALSRQLYEAVADLESHPNVAEIRQHGMILAIELVKDKANKTPYPWQERRGLRVFKHALTQGVLLRPLGNVIYFMPPYIITPEQITQIASAARSGIHIATQE